MTQAWLKNFLSLRKPRAVLLAVVGIAVVGWVDFLTGVEYRVFTLYYLPLSMAAWHLGRAGTLSAASLCTVSWLASNYLAGLRYDSPTIWVVNLIMQSASFVAVGLLIAALRAAFLQAHHRSRTDFLTSLLNTEAFAEEAERLLALGRRHRRPLTLAYIDLDNFKVVNDTLGHHAGDELLRATGALLRQTLRSTDVAARVGGDEFVVLLPETGPEGARRLLNRLHGLLRESFESGASPVTASVGAVSFLEPPLGLDEIIRRADALMYQAKLAGKDRLQFSVAGSPASATTFADSVAAGATSPDGSPTGGTSERLDGPTASGSGTI